jgi:haloacetate dehalogenase
MLFLQAVHDDIDIHGDPVAIWRPWVAGPLCAAMIDSGHHQAEDAPEEVAAALLDFLA